MSRARMFGVLTIAAVLASSLSAVTAAAQATDEIVINEVVASNDSTVDNFGGTPDWIELRSIAGPVDLNGWTISDESTSWTLPSVTVAAGERLLIWASDRDLTGPELHTNFKLSASGETIRLSRPDGTLADELAFPELGADQAYGSDEAGAIGYLLTGTPGAANAGLAPGVVVIDTPSQAFNGSLTIALSANLLAGQTIRYTTSGATVADNSAAYTGPLTLTESTVLRTAVTTSTAVGAERTAGYIAIDDNLVNRTSDLPMVLVQASGTIGTTDQQAIVSVINRGQDGRASVLGPADYAGFAGLRIRGDSSSNFPKKQYKFELWENLAGDSRDGELLGIGTDDDWGLYAPGRFDRAMIQNPFVYELGTQVGVPAPGYQFVELWIEDSVGSLVGAGDYQGLYMLRETIEIDGDRIDITKHTPTTAGPDGGYIIRQDRPDSCCATLRSLNDVSGGVVAVNEPSATDISAGQLSYIDGWWDDMLDAAASGDVSQVEQYIDMDDWIDYWLMVMLSGDPDGFRLSTYMYKDAGGLLQGGPLWDYDRTLGSADSRNNDLSDADGWGSSDLLISFDFVGDLWAIPEIQARLKARWAQLRQAELSDAALAAVSNGLRDEILESYDRELTVWNSSLYGPRFGNGLAGEVDFMQQFVQLRVDWMDAELSSSSNPVVTDPGTVTVGENEALDLQLVVSGGVAFDFSASGLPAGLSVNSAGLIRGIVAYGDAQSGPVTVTVTNETGGSTQVLFDLNVTPGFSGNASVVLNEYNAVAPGELLDLGGSDTTFGRVEGNGGDWFEVVTVQDNLDLRGWRFEPYSNGPGGVQQTAALVLGDDPRLADVRAGTIITVAESVADDLSYDPANGDWNITLQANTQQQGALWANQTNFDTNNSRWRLVVRDAELVLRGPVAGETKPWDDVNLGVSATEVMQLRTDPTTTPDLVLDYGDATDSTFNGPNPVAGGVQDFSAIRPVIRPSGDVTCDGAFDIGDALTVAQFSVGTRTPVDGCPLSSPGTQINVLQADFDSNGAVDIGDALLIARCTVGLDPQGLCPDP